ncbi:MAG: MoxR family ATPase [Herpetosiphonaceae bacterium]|nr:MoxR family ATPase [Herpetosiphonaceae bacterium]
MTTDFAPLAAVATRIISEVERVVVGKRPQLTQMLAAMLGGGHILLEDYPGLAKTLIAKSFATALGLEFKRIQFTPDLLPSDITGSYVYDRSQGRFELRKGPIFAHIILADEINRASPKTQSALLEAMQEYQVTLEGETLPLPQPFIVIATQNPIEYEGTFPLPEAQLDRFLVKLGLGYPSIDEEQEILRRRQERRSDDLAVQQVTNAAELLELREIVEAVYAVPDIQRYIVMLVNATRNDRRVAVGASPRGSLALFRLARVRAALDCREYVLPDDVKAFAKPALIHRLMLEPNLWLQPRAADEVIEMLLQQVPVPVSNGSR